MSVFRLHRTKEGLTLIEFLNESSNIFCSLWNRNDLVEKKIPDYLKDRSHIIEVKEFIDNIQRTFDLLEKDNGEFLLKENDLGCPYLDSSVEIKKEILDYLWSMSDIPEVKKFIDKVESKNLTKDRDEKYSYLRVILKAFVKAGNTQDIGVNFSVKYSDGNNRSLLVLTIYRDFEEIWYVYRWDRGLREYILNNSEKILREVNLVPYLPTNEILAKSLKRFSRKTNSQKSLSLRDLIVDLIVQGDWPTFVDKELTPIFDYVTTVENVKYYFVSSK